MYIYIYIHIYIYTYLYIYISIHIYLYNTVDLGSSVVNTESARGVINPRYLKKECDIHKERERYIDVDVAIYINIDSYRCIYI